MNETFDWINFKAFVNNNNLQILYRNSVYYSSNDPNAGDTLSYSLETVYNGVVFYCTIVKDSGANQTEFENSYKSSAIEIL